MATQLNTEGFSGDDENEFKRFYSMNKKRLCYFIRKIINNNEDDEDIAADAFAIVFKRFKDFESPAAMKSFLYTTARNRSLNYIKHQKVRSAHEKETRHTNQDNQDPEMERTMIRTEVIKELYEAIPMLPPKCREICELHYFNSLPTNKIAEKLNISVSNVGTQLKIALGKLSRLIKI